MSVSLQPYDDWRPTHYVYYVITGDVVSAALGGTCQMRATYVVDSISSTFGVRSTQNFKWRREEDLPLVHFKHVVLPIHLRGT